MKTGRELESPPTRGLIGWLAAILCWVLLFCVAAVLVGWLGGDTREWSLELSWVPAVALLPLIVLGLLIVGVVRGGMGTFLMRMLFLCLVFVVAWIVGTEWGMFRAGKEEPGDFVVVQWNASWPSQYAALESAYDAVSASNPDLVVITEPGQFGWGERGQAFQKGWPYSSRLTNVLLLSRTPFNRVHPVVNADGIVLVLVELEVMDRMANVWVLDLPSDPLRVRKQIFSVLKEKTEEAKLSTPDLVMGDLNVTRHSRALEDAFPNLRNAFDEGGVGWVGTWTRRFPLWQLDQILVGPEMRCIRYEVIDPGVGDHRLQRAAIRWTTTSSPSS